MADEEKTTKTICDGCGLCCSVALCAMAQGYHGVETRAPCPSLLLEDGRYWCGILDALKRRDYEGRRGQEVVEPTGAGALVALIQKALGIGLGCEIPAEKAVYELGRQIRRLDDGDGIHLGPYEHAACAACRKRGKEVCDCSSGDKRPCGNMESCLKKGEACESEADGWRLGCWTYMPREDGP